MWTSTSSGRIELQMTKAQAASCSHSGSCDTDVRALSQVPAIRRQLAKIDAALLRNELSEYGAWDDEELTNHEQNLQRLLWTMANDISEKVAE
jgi:hypothetical protein